MRRKERNVTDKAALGAIIADCFYTILSMAGASAPYQVPMNFGYDAEAGKVYLHCARVGRRLEILREAGGSVPASLSFVSKASLLDKGLESACDLSTRYASVIATGALREVTDSAERLRGLRCLAVQAGVGERPFTEKDLAAVAVLCVTISDIVGKVNDPEQNALRK